MFPPPPTEDPVELADSLCASLQRALPFVCEGVLTEYPESRYHLLFPLRRSLPSDMNRDFWGYATSYLKEAGWKMLERKTHRKYLAMVIAPKTS